MSTALSIQDLHFGYSGRSTIGGVSLRVDAGDCYGFLGHNGAGKTTVMRLALGLLQPSRGRVAVFGADARLRRREANGLIGALIERPGFHLHLSARHNLRALARLQGIARPAASAEVERVIEAVGLTTAIDRRVGTFSMGMRQRLGIAQAMLGQPRLLLLDEPTNGLDPEGIAELRALLQHLTREQGVAVLLSSHQLAELEGLCTRVGVLREGEMIAEGDLETLRRRVGVRHVVCGAPVDALAQTLEGMQLRPERDGDRLLVDLGDQAPGDVTRALTSAGELTSFAPEQATLERIYLQAGSVDLPAPAAAPSTSAPAPSPAMGRTDRALRRAAAFEAGVLARRRSSAPLLLLPCLTAAASVWNYRSDVQAGLAKVEAGAQFSADAGSGYLAVAQSLQSATPVLALALLWFASQTIAADVAADTLRNTAIRSVKRADIWLGKLGVMLAAAAVGWAALVATAAATSWATLGFGDLEEVTRYGERDLLAAASDVLPTTLTAVGVLALPLAAVTVLATAASALARRPAMALALAAAALLAPDLVRIWSPSQSGWLLTSHLPTLWGDDSALAFLSATARGASDALWLHEPLALWAPLAWIAAAAALLASVVPRMRIS